MSILKKRKNTGPKEPSTVEPKGPSVEDEILSVLKEIRDNMPSREERIFLAVLSGDVAKQGSANSEGQPAAGLAEMAAKFTAMVGRLK